MPDTPAWKPVEEDTSAWKPVEETPKPSPSFGERALDATGEFVKGIGSSLRSAVTRNLMIPGVEHPGIQVTDPWHPSNNKGDPIDPLSDVKPIISGFRNNPAHAIGEAVPFLVRPGAEAATPRLAEATREGLRTARATPLPSPLRLSLGAASVYPLELAGHALGLPPGVPAAADAAYMASPKLIGFGRGVVQNFRQSPFGPAPGAAPPPPPARVPVWERNVTPDQALLRSASRAVSPPVEPIGPPSTAPLLREGNPEDAQFLNQYRQAVRFPRYSRDNGPEPGANILPIGPPGQRPRFNLDTPGASLDTPGAAQPAPLIRMPVNGNGIAHAPEAPAVLSNPKAAPVAEQLFHEMKASGDIPPEAEPGKPIGRTEEESSAPFEERARTNRASNASSLAGLLHTHGIPSGDLVNMGPTDWRQVSKAAGIEFPTGKSAQGKLIREAGSHLRGLENQ